MKVNCTFVKQTSLLILFLGYLNSGYHLGAAPRFVMEIRDHEGKISIAGESDAPGHEGAIEVLSFGKSYSTPQGFVPLDTTTIHCGIAIDKAFPKLAAAATGQGGSLAQVDIFYLGDNSLGAPNEAAHMRLHYAQVTGLVVNVKSDALSETNNASDPEATAQLSLYFSKVSWIYQQLDQEGKILLEESTETVAFDGTEDPGFDEDKDGLSNALDDDDDGDQIPDSEETKLGLNPLLDDANNDLDFDRISNRDEWLAGTGLNDPTSFFSIRSITIERTPTGRIAKVTFPVTSNRHYRLLGTTDLKQPFENWTEFVSHDTPTDHSEDEAEVVLGEDVIPQLSNMFLFVEVSNP